MLHVLLSSVMCLRFGLRLRRRVLSDLWNDSKALASKKENISTKKNKIQKTHSQTKWFAFLSKNNDKKKCTRKYSFREVFCASARNAFRLVLTSNQHTHSQVKFKWCSASFTVIIMEPFFGKVKLHFSLAVCVCCSCAL